VAGCRDERVERSIFNPRSDNQQPFDNPRSIIKNGLFGG
jgi:hypothetical protein